jgi:hypothetical protein
MQLGLIFQTACAKNQQVKQGKSVGEIDSLIIIITRTHTRTSTFFCRWSSEKMKLQE